jgi:hypothetical protein
MCVAVVSVGLLGCEQRRKLEDVPPAAQAPAEAGAQEYTLVMKAVRQEAGAAEVVVEITPASGLKINPEYPWKASFEASAGLGLGGGLKLGREAFVMEEKVARLPVKLEGAQVGAHTLRGQVSFSVCEVGGAQRCLMFKDEPVELAMQITGGGAP